MDRGSKLLSEITSYAMQGNVAMPGAWATWTWCVRSDFRFDLTIKREWWLARALVLHSIRQDIVALAILGAHNLASPLHIQEFSRLPVPRLILMRTMIPPALPLALVEAIWSYFVPITRILSLIMSSFFLLGFRILNLN